MSDTELCIPTSHAVFLIKSTDLVHIDGRYRLQCKVGCSSFGKYKAIALCLLYIHKSICETYLVHEILLEKDVIIKLEPENGKHHTVEHEFHVYKKLVGGTGILCVHWFGTEAGFNAITINHLSLSLDDICVHFHCQFSLRTVLFITCQLVSDHYPWYENLWPNLFYVQISHLQHVHSHNFVHHALRHSNLIMGIGKQANLVYLINFGLLKEFRDPKTHIHILYNNTLSLTGLALFTSITGHLGVELGRHDDLESLTYILIYFLHGSLPWQGLSYCQVVVSKQSTSILDLYHDLPVEFYVLLDYSCSLSFDIVAVATGPPNLHQENLSALARGWPNLSPLANLASHFSLAGLGPTSAMALQERQVIQWSGRWYNKAASDSEAASDIAKLQMI